MATQMLDVKRAVSPERRTKLAVFTFKMMRKWVGILGILVGFLLPVISLVFGKCGTIQESISHYYYTVSGNVFVGLLCAVAFFLIIYPGDGEWEDLLTNIAGILALVIAFFPTTFEQINIACARQSFQFESWVSKVHFSAAASFFIILGYVSFRQFPSKLSRTKNLSSGSLDMIYKLCGITMWLCIAFLAPMAVYKDYAHFLSRNKLVFIGEVVALLAFGTSWLVKGTEMEGENS